MKITIELSDESVVQLRRVMKETDYPSEELAEFCVFLLRNALSQVQSLIKMRNEAPMPPPEAIP